MSTADIRDRQLRRCCDALAAVDPGVLQPAPDDELQEALWLRTRTAARMLRRRLPAGLVLEHPDGRRAASGRGRPEVIVSGAPSELICWVYGRQPVAAVTVREE